jgi:pimeloyl-ACP methyl ester carboxylesterase
MLCHKVFTNSDSNDWVCFIHGAGGSSSIWYPQLKEFSKNYNVLVMDLRGHGKSRSLKIKDVKKFNFDVIVDDIQEVLDFQKIESAHFVGISLGTIIIRCIAERSPEKVKSMILGGAVFKLSVKSTFLIRLGNLTKSFIPHIVLYRLFANIIIPKKAFNHSRNFFIREAKKVYHREFKKWFVLTSKLKPLLYFFREKEHVSPTLYIMGEHDSMFLPGIKSLIKKHKRSRLVVLENSGHVVNIDASKAFNETTIAFINEHRST